MIGWLIFEKTLAGNLNLVRSYFITTVPKSYFYLKSIYSQSATKFEKITNSDVTFTK